MKPLSEFSPPDIRQIRGVLFDIDDTLTTKGQLAPRLVQRFVRDAATRERD